MENKATSGKVGFAVNYNGKPAAEVEAITNALQSYEDGIFRIFIDDTETEDLSSPTGLKEESIITFILCEVFQYFALLQAFIIFTDLPTDDGFNQPLYIDRRNRKIDRNLFDIALSLS